MASIESTDSVGNRVASFLATKMPGEWFTLEELISAVWPELPEQAAIEVAEEFIERGMRKWLCKTADEVIP